MWALIAGLVVFLGIHMARVVAPDFRQSVIDGKGENAWKGIYSIASLVGFVLLIWGYGAARVSESNTFFYAGPVWFTHIVWLLMVPVMILLVASQLPAGHIKARMKNPMLIAVKIWAFAHLLVNGDLASLLLFGGFLIWAVIVVINTKRRGLPAPQPTSKTSDVISVVVGLGLWAAFAFALHEWLIGVPVIA